MTHTTSRIDPEALSELVKHWLWKTRNTRRTGVPDGDDSGAKHAADLVGLNGHLEESVDVSLPEMFMLGFDLGVQVAGAVVSDPLGDPTTEIYAATEGINALLNYNEAESRWSMACNEAKELKSRATVTRLRNNGAKQTGAPKSRARKRRTVQPEVIPA